MKSAEEIVDLYYTRSSNYAGVKEKMRLIRDHYNGDVIVPLPEIDSTEASSVANLLAQGLDQTAMRIASVTPDIVCPPEDESSKQAQKFASIRRKALFGCVFFPAQFPFSRYYWLKIPLHFPLFDRNLFPCHVRLYGDMF